MPKKKKVSKPESFDPAEDDLRRQELAEQLMQELEDDDLAFTNEAIASFDEVNAGDMLETLGDVTSIDIQSTLEDGQEFDVDGYKIKRN